MPHVAQPPLAMLEIPCVLGSELPTPLPYGLVGDDDSPLRQEFLDVAEAEAEPVVQPDAVTDDPRRKPIATIVVGIRFSSPESAGAGSS